jgi:hypothetical protein
MRHRVRPIVAVVAILIGVALIPDAYVQAATAQYPIGEGRTCPPGKPRAVVGTVKHQKRYSLPLYPPLASDRFLVRL